MPKNVWGEERRIEGENGRISVTPTPRGKVDVLASDENGVVLIRVTPDTALELATGLTAMAIEARRNANERPRRGE